MLFIVLVIYIGGYLVAVPRVVRAFAKDLSAVLPLDEADKFVAVFFGLLLSASWPLLLIGVIVKNLMFPALFKEDRMSDHEALVECATEAGADEVMRQPRYAVDAVRQLRQDYDEALEQMRQADAAARRTMAERDKLREALAYLLTDAEAVSAGEHALGWLDGGIHKARAALSPEEETDDGS